MCFDFRSINSSVLDFSKSFIYSTFAKAFNRAWSMCDS